MTEYTDDFDPLDEDALPPKPVRDGKGRFVKGSSGNPAGQAYRIPRDPSLPASRRRIINAVADEEVEVKVNGKPRRMSLYEANVRALGLAGTRDRVAALKFIELTNETSERHLARRLRSQELLEEMNALVEENMRLKAKYAPTSGVVTLGPEEWEKFQQSRMLDDEQGVAEAMKRRGDFT